MGTSHTFFVADDSRLEQLFPGWKPARPASSAHTDSLFGDPPSFRWAPVAEPAPLGTPSLHDNVWGAPILPVALAASEAAVSLEESGAAGLRALPHFRTKDCALALELQAFSDALVGSHHAALPALVGPDDHVDALPAAATRQLADAGEDDLVGAAERLLALDREAAWSVDELVEAVLVPLQSLARSAELEGARLCHYWSADGARAKSVSSRDISSS